MVVTLTLPPNENMKKYHQLLLQHKKTSVFIKLIAAQEQCTMFENANKITTHFSANNYTLDIDFLKIRQGQN